MGSGCIKRLAQCTHCLFYLTSTVRYTFWLKKKRLTLVNRRSCQNCVSVQQCLSIPGSIIFTHSFQIVHKFQHAWIFYCYLIKILKFNIKINQSLFSFFSLHFYSQTGQKIARQQCQSSCAYLSFPRRSNSENQLAHVMDTNYYLILINKGKSLAILAEHSSTPNQPSCIIWDID